MFKKKSNALSRPKPPASNHILEDLAVSPKDDPVFTLMNKNNAPNERRKSSLNEDGNLEQPSTYTKHILNGPDEVYEKVKSFVETNNKLRNKMQRLQDQNEALHMSDLELKRIAEDIRKQALDALK